MKRPAADKWLIPHKAGFSLASLDPGGTPAAPGAKKKTEEASEKLHERLIGLQERLWAEDRRSVLLVLQAMDGGGKDGAIRKVFSGVNPQGCVVTSFKVPSEEERQHDFLWRIHKAVPRRGEIGIFNRSHYEDVGIVRVKKLVPKDVWSKRYAIINAFEYGLAEEDTKVIKVFLHISKEEQADRFRKRLDDPTKNWKFKAADLVERERWDDYMLAYSDAINKTTRPHAPWYVLPADHKWYRDWALLSILVATLEEMNPQYPPPEPDLDKVKIH